MSPCATDTLAGHLNKGLNHLHLQGITCTSLICMLCQCVTDSHILETAECEKFDNIVYVLQIFMRQNCNFYES